MKQRIYAGTYTQPGPAGKGDRQALLGKGIHILELDTENLSLREILPPYPTPNPTYLALHKNGRVLYAVNELKEFEGQPGGGLSAFSILDDGSLKLLNTKPSYGINPVHLDAALDGRHLVAANFSSGSVCVYALNQDGSLGERTDFIQHEGSGPHPNQQGPHAHTALFTPEGKYLLLPDLGIDRVMAYVLDPQTGKLGPAPVPHHVCRPGSGPSTGVFHPALPILYLINELDGTLSVFRYEHVTGALAEIQQVPTLPTGFSETNTNADVRLSPDSRFVYASNRGNDSIAVYAADKATGLLSLIEIVKTGGRTPRQFALINDIILAGNQNSGTISILKRDPDSGRLSLHGFFELPKTVCLLPVGAPRP